MSDNPTRPRAARASTLPLQGRDSPVRFGINFLPHRARELLDWVKAAEDTGFDIAGVADSQSLYRDVYVCEALVATNTKSIRFGSRVINPLTRHPAGAACAAATLEELAPGRTMLGVGTGDSAVDNIGIRPSTLAEMSDYVRAVRELLETGQAAYKGAPCKLTWWNGKCNPIHLAASGPETLQLAGEIADGVVINTGLTPEIIRDSIAQVGIGAARAGRDPSAVDMWWLPLTCVDDDYARAAQGRAHPRVGRQSSDAPRHQRQARAAGADGEGERVGATLQHRAA